MNKFMVYALCVGVLIGGTLIYKGSRPNIPATRSLNDQLVSFLQEYIRIKTVHPAPDYAQAIAFLKTNAQQDGFEYQEVNLPSGKTVLVISYPGSDPSLPALALNHHMDVVPVNDAQAWVKPPFAGEIHEGALIGRGTQDMKGIGATHYFALKELKSLGITPRRTIHLFAVPEEEVGGFKGTQEFVETPAFKKLAIGYIIDEGHASGQEGVLDIKVTERKPIQVQVTAQGALAHGSHLHAHNAIHDLVTFLGEIVSLHTEQQEIVDQKPGQLLSCNITSLTAGIRKENGHIALNMVPDSAQATIDIRVPPTRKRAEVLSLFEKILSGYPQITYTVLAQATEEPEAHEYGTPLYQALAQAIAQSGLQAQPHFFEASSDLRFYQSRGIDGVGLSPFTVEDNIHGTNESVPLDQLIRGKDITVQLLKDFCA